MYLENLVVDALEPQRLGRFWEAVIAGERLTDEPAGFETRLAVTGGPELDLCFQRVTDPSSGPPRLHLEIAGGPDLGQEVDRLLGLGARRLGTGPGQASRVALTDPEGNPFGVVEGAAAHAGTGPVAALLLQSAAPDTDAAFWSWLTGWTDAPGVAPRTLRHPSRLGPLLELSPEPSAKGPTKNRLHLDVRLEAGDDPDQVAAGIAERGGRELHPPWGDLPWRLHADPSGNELCVLPARA
jgi:hypothetical protein